MKEIKNILPIGSVVLLKGGSKKLMIYGVMQSDTEGNDYDYIGVLYPEGNIGAQAQFLFQHEDIEEIVFRGYENQERDAFIQKLDNYFKSH
jgi:hypothetical protein